MKQKIDFKDIDRSNYYGEKHFPSRTDYLNYLENFTKSNFPVEDNLESAIAIQRHWHRDGQNGCVFAQVASGRNEKYRWKYEVCNSDFHVIEGKDIIDEIDKKIKKGILDEECELLSILFPCINSDFQLNNLIYTLIDCETILLENTLEYEALKTVALRVDITGTGIIAWVMGFGPFDYFPNTRIAPMVEIVIRVKPKSETIFEKLSQDRTVAHNADIPLHMKEKTAHHLWMKTMQSTKNILGHKPNHFSAAKTTFTMKN